MTNYVRACDRELGLNGCYAGVATRFGAFVVDIATVATSFALAGMVVEFIISALIGDEFKLRDAPIASMVALAGWWFFYCAYALSVSGRTPGMAAIGLRVVRADGAELDVSHAVLRVVLFPLSFLLFGLGFLLIVVRKDRRALHDLLVGTCVVYAWDARAARLQFLDRSPPPAALVDPPSPGSAS
jgi:uncharacterized RDD family membrane protein YckC